MRIAKVIIGETDSRITRPFGRLLKKDGYDVHVADKGKRVLEIVRGQPYPDLLLLDNALKNPDAAEVCRVVKSDPLLNIIPIVTLMAEGDMSDHKPMLQAGCDDILIEPAPSVFLARVQSLLRLKYVYDGLDDAESVLYTLTRTIEAKDRYTMGHADRVAHFAMDLGKALGVKKSELEILRKGGMLHDIGKIAIPDAILTKPGKYTPEEFAIMKKHPDLGCEICGKLRSVRDAIPMIRHHHEKLDGTGYPDGLGGGQIPVLVRIVNIVDIYDALRSRRSYKDAFSIDKSFEIMWEEVGKGWWDKEVLSAWEKVVRGKKRDNN